MKADRQRRPDPRPPRAVRRERQQSSALCLFPSRPRAVTDALHALAETPGLTHAEYEREKARILAGT